MHVAEGVAEVEELFLGEAVGHFGVGPLMAHVEDVAQVDKGVAGHGEGELGLADGFAFDGGDEEGAGVADGD